MNVQVKKSLQKPLEIVPIQPPAVEERVQRDARFAEPGEKKSRYTMPDALESGSPVGYRHRVSMTRDEAQSMMPLLSLSRPTGFVETDAVTEGELFEESSLGILSARQSTNYRGHRQASFGPEDSRRIADLIRGCDNLEAPVLDGAQYTHLVFSRPYRTPFTMLLTFIGHNKWTSMAGVAKRAWDKRVRHADDIPTVGYLQQLHLGILADALERGVIIASNGKRRANILQAPFTGSGRKGNEAIIRKLEDFAGLTPAERRAGWRLAFVAQVGGAKPAETVKAEPSTFRIFGANLLAFRSERIQPGVNAEAKAPEQYHQRQNMDVPDELTVMAGRAAYNAFVHWTGVDRERSKELLLLERVDVLTPNGKERLRQIREELGAVSEEVITNIPLWADLPTGRALTRNSARAKKAFGLAGQRIYIGGLDRTEIADEGMDWDLAVRAFGAAAARSALVGEIAGVVELPEDCDLLSGICLMAGPVNQNDIGKTFYGYKDLLCGAFPGQDPTSLLVWTMKAKTIADPIGNEEQLMNAARKGALVDLRPAPHEVVALKRASGFEPMRKRGTRTNAERAFEDLGNFVTDRNGRGIPGNRGSRWPEAWRDERIW